MDPGKHSIVWISASEAPISTWNEDKDKDFNLGNIFFCKNGDISMNTDQIPDAEFMLYIFIYYLFILRTYKFHF